MSPSKKLHKILFSTVFVGVMLGALWHALPVQAQGINFGMNTIASGTGLGTEDIRVIIAKIIRAVLGILGIVALLIVIWGGYEYMTAGGDDEKVNRAKSILTNGAIGLLIILSSAALVQFVLTQLSGAINGDNGANGDGGQTPPGCIGICIAGLERNFYIKSITPSDANDSSQTINARNLVIRVIFSQGINSSANKDSIITVRKDGTNISDQFNYNFIGDSRTMLEAEPKSTDGKIDNGFYVVSVDENTLSDSNKALQTSIGGNNFPSSAEFTVRALDSLHDTDEENPAITSFQVNGLTADVIYLPRGGSYQVAAQATDNTGVGYAVLSADSISGGQGWYEGPLVARGSLAIQTNPYNFSRTLVVPQSLDPMSEHTISLTIHDIDHKFVTVSQRVQIVGENCDVGTGIGTGSDCVQETKPTISRISPDNGVAASTDNFDSGTWVTVEGSNFGTTPGTVEFGYDSNNNNTIDDNEWWPARSPDCAGADTWQDTWFLVQVPRLPMGVHAVIRMKRADYDVTTPGKDKMFDTTDDERGARQYFTVNDKVYPGLCSVAVSPGQDGAGANESLPGVKVVALGRNLGAAGDTSVFSFGGVPTSYSDWQDKQIDSAVPLNMVPGKVGVFAVQDGLESNHLPYTVLTAAEAMRPIINSISPNPTSRLSYVTISGSRFGEQKNIVYLSSDLNVKTCDTTNASTCIQANLDLSNPDCGNTWSDTQIIFEVPDNIAPGKYAVIVENANKLQNITRDQVLAITDLQPMPSICRIDPVEVGSAPLPTDHPGIKIIGANFKPDNTTAATVYFWSHNASVDNPRDLSKLLSAEIPNIPLTGNTPSKDNANIRTRLPVGTDGYSVQSGSLFVRVGTIESNSAALKISDCNKPNAVSPDINNYQCCSADGVDKGRWLPNTAICAGQTRAAGYVWRFSTGNIPQAARVVEECNEADWKDAAQQIDFPSPVPWVNWREGSSVCLNATLAVRFSADVTSASVQKSTGNVRLYKCGNGAAPAEDCLSSGHPENDLTSTINPKYESRVLKIKEPLNNSDKLEPNTWYRVILTDGINSVRTVQEFGRTVELTEPIIKTKPCGQVRVGNSDKETAYCYDFKTLAASTDSTNATCKISAIGINPPNYTATRLGPLLDPRYPLAENVPFYFYLWGRGNQPCSVVSVENKGWLWGVLDPNVDSNAAKLAGKATDYAEALNAPSVGPVPDGGYKYVDTRGAVTAKQPTAPKLVQISAAADSLNAAVLSGYWHKINDLLKLATVNNNTSELSIENVADVKTINPLLGNESLGFTNFSTMTIKFVLKDLGDPSAMSPAVAAQNGFVQSGNTWTDQRYLFKKGEAINVWVTDSQIQGEYYRTLHATVLLSSGGSVTLTGVSKQLSPDEWSVKSTEKTTVLIVKNDSIWSLYWNDEQIQALNIHDDQVVNSDPIMIGANSISITETPFNVGLLHGTINDFLWESTNMPVGGNVDLRAHSDLTIDLEDPKVVEYWPSCYEACVNSEVGLRFNREMDVTTYQNGITVFECADENCDSATRTPVNDYVVSPELQTPTILRATLGSNVLLKPNTFYVEQINSGVNGVRTIGGYDSSGHAISGKVVQPYERKFRTKANGTACSVSTVYLQPDKFLATFVGQKTKFVATPCGSPDQCSPYGQALSPWSFGWEWHIVDPLVADVTQFSTAGSFRPYCTGNCVLKGSTIEKGVEDVATCGNGVPDPGEDCEIGASGEEPNVSCTLNCLRPGNKNAATAVTATDVGLCGDGHVNTSVGEECDPNDVNPVSSLNTKIGCSNTCQHLGSSKVVTGEGSVCGSGTVTAGEECENGKNNEVEGKTCSGSCLHLGRSVIRYWCDGHSNFATNLACLNSFSQCGNGKIESGEECEIVNGRVSVSSTTGMPVETNLPASDDTDALGNVTVRAACSNKCKLQNVCDATTGQPSTLLQGSGSQFTCVKGTEGCNSDCTLAGSSVSYSKSSLCGDTEVGIGEVASCESPKNDNNLGLNPIQIVTARGLGAIADADLKVQMTTILAKVVSYWDSKNNKKVVLPTTPNNLQIEGNARYALQCGNTEFDIKNNAGKYNDCQGASQGVAANSCCYERPTRISSVPKDMGGFAQGNSASDLPVCRNAYLEVTFDKTLDQATLKSFSVSSAESVKGAVNLSATSVVTGGALAGTTTTQDVSKIILTHNIDSLTAHTEATTHFVAANGANPASASTEVRTTLNGSGREAVTTFNAQVVASDPSLVPSQIGSVVDATIKTTASETGSASTVILARAATANMSSCASSGEEDVTTDVEQALGIFGTVKPPATADEDNIFQTIWNWLKSWVSTIFGRSVSASSFNYGAVGAGDITHWCSGKVGLTLGIGPSPDNATNTRVVMTINNLLESDTVYAVVFRGGKNGVKDILGVGIANPNSADTLSDAVVFKTGDTICKIDTVKVGPIGHLYTKPATSKQFTATPFNLQGQRVVSIDGIYAWKWVWGPQNNDIFAIPNSVVTTDISTITIASKNVEGEITATAAAEITSDISPPTTVGNMYFGYTSLKAMFCENPWPPADKYPFEDGISFGTTEPHNSGFNNGVFDGSILTGQSMNFSFSYCADSGISGITADDLPYMRPYRYGATTP